MAEGSSPDADEKLFLGSLRASRAIKNPLWHGGPCTHVHNVLARDFPLHFVQM